MSDVKLPKAGRYKGKVTDYGAKETAKKEPAIAIRVTFLDAEGAQHDVVWQGSLSHGTDPTKKRPLDITLETLEACGFDFHKHRNLLPIADGISSNALDMETEVLVTVEIATWEGKPFARAQYINRAGGFKGGLGKETFATKCAGLNLDAEVAAYRSKVAPQPRPASVTNALAAAVEMPNLNDIPF